MEISLTTKIDSEEEDFTQDIYNQPTGLQNKDFNTVLKSRVDSFYTIDLNVNSGWQQISDSYAYTVYVGYRRDDYSIDAYDGLRTDLADNSKTPISGEFRSYQAVYSIPYIGAAVRSDQDKAWRFKTSLYYSPLTDLEDENKDFYQDRISEGSADGNSILAEADFYYDITTSFTLNLKLKYNKSDLEGKLKYDEYLNSAANDYSSENEFYQYDIGIGFNF